MSGVWLLNWKDIKWKRLWNYINVSQNIKWICCCHFDKWFSESEINKFKACYVDGNWIYKKKQKKKLEP